jgi:hypothetical protein
MAVTRAIVNVSLPIRLDEVLGVFFFLSWISTDLTETI